MHIDAGERLRLTLWGAGGRAMVSVNAFPVTQHAIEGLDPSEDGFTYDVTPWLHAGRNTLTVMLIDAPGAPAFRMGVAQDGRPVWTLDEADLPPCRAPWRLWTRAIEYHSAVDAPLLVTTVQLVQSPLPAPEETALPLTVADRSFTQSLPWLPTVPGIIGAMVMKATRAATERPPTMLERGTQDGLRQSVRRAYAAVPAEPLPAEHVELLLALRRREREQTARAA